MVESTYTTEQIAQNWVTWLNALASGKYKKTIGSLHSTVDGEERHCCLGVAQLCLGLPKKEGGTDSRLVPLLGLNNIVGSAAQGKSIVSLNDSHHYCDIDFVNMHRELLANIEGFTHHNPEVAPLVRKMLAERNT